MAIAFVNSFYNTVTGTQTSMTVTSSSAVTSGDLMIILVDWGTATGHVASITDTLGNTWVLAIAEQGNSSSVEIWYSQLTVAGASMIATINFTGGTVTHPEAEILEFSGLATTGSLDRTIGNTAASSTAPTTTASATTRQANELLISMCNISTNISGFEASWTGVTTSNGNGFEYFIVSATGAYTATYTSTSGNYAAALATFSDTTISSGTLPSESVNPRIYVP